MNFRLKPRGFWDYGLFALGITLLFLFLTWSEIGEDVNWRDAMFAFAAAVLLVLMIIAVRRGEKAAWIKSPSWYVSLLVILGFAGFFTGFVYADAYVLHREHYSATLHRFNLYIPTGCMLLFSLWSWYKRRHIRIGV